MVVHAHEGNVVQLAAYFCSSRRTVVSVHELLLASKRDLNLRFCLSRASYAVYPKPGLKLISVNTIYCSEVNL